MTKTEATFAENIGAAWDLFYHESGCVEVRALLKTHAESPKVWEGRGDIISGYFNDFTAFSKAVTGLDGDKRTKGVYVTMNPCVSALMGRANNRLIAAGKGTTTGDNDIVSRKTLLIDCDPFRPSEIASTQAEMDTAIAKRDEVAASLYGQGFPLMYKADSGNGAHLIGCIDLPNNEEAKRLVSDFLECLNWKFGAVPSDAAEAKRAFAAGVVNVGIDCTVFNASRITKLYGTAVRKGDDTPDRPHRRAKFTAIPSEKTIIPTELIARIGQEWRRHKEEQERPKATSSTNGARTAAKPSDWWATADGFERWFAGHGRTLRNRATYTNDSYDFKWDVDCITSHEHTDGAAVFWGADGKLGYKCHHDSCKGKGWADVRAILDPKVSNGKATSGPAASKPKQATGGNTANMLDALDRLGYVFRQNELDDSIEVNGKTISDGIAAEIRCAMRDKGFSGMDAVKDAYTMSAYHQRYHPIKDFFAGLAWDGKDHIGRLATHFVSHDPPIIYGDGSRRTVIHAFLVRFLVGASAKVHEQAQNIMLTLAGPQGIGKSTVPAWLCSPLPDFFNESQLDPDGKETDRRLAKTFLWEIGELGATTRRADVNALKNKLTQTHVTFRVPYGHYDVTKPVLTSFIGTVNPDGRGFLVDKTGSRRFATVNIESIKFAYYTDIDPRQVWAQAAALYRAGEQWRLTPEETVTQAAINAEHQSEDTIDMIMPELFILDPCNDTLATAPIDIAWELFYKNYAKDLDRCAKDAAAWLKNNGYAKKGKPLTWRGIALRYPKKKEDTPYTP